VHRLPAHCKLVAVIVFVLLVVATPRTAFWAFGAYALLLAGVSTLAQVPPATLLRRMTVEVPFVLFALLLPFVAEGPRVDVLGVAVSESGLLAAWNILAKGTLGVLAAVLLAATTPARQLLLGLERLHMPALMVQIMSFMFRYANVVGAEMARMKVARESRGFQAATCGTPALSRSRPARCSSAPTSAASACIWPCSAAATPADAHRGRAAGRPPAVGGVGSAADRGARHPRHRLAGPVVKQPMTPRRRW
jgi:cobalt/nickel transport system permease protein